MITFIALCLFAYAIVFIAVWLARHSESLAEAEARELDRLGDGLQPRRKGGDRAFQRYHHPPRIGHLYVDQTPYDESSGVFDAD